jgi:hypothetical protein
MLVWERVDAGIQESVEGRIGVDVEWSIEVNEAAGVKRLCECQVQGHRIVLDLEKVKSLILNVNVQRLGNVNILRCQGQITTGDVGTSLRNTVLSHRDY